MSLVNPRLMSWWPWTAMAVLVAGCQSFPNNRGNPKLDGRFGTLVVDQSSAGGASWEFKPEGGDWKPIQVPAGGWRAQGYTCDAGMYRTWMTIAPCWSGKDNY
jgi:hypothetical protein